MARQSQEELTRRDKETALGTLLATITDAELSREEPLRLLGVE